MTNMFQFSFLKSPVFNFKSVNYALIIVGNTNVAINWRLPAEKKFDATFCRYGIQVIVCQIMNS